VSTPEGVLAFWFGPAARSEAELLAKLQRWFAGGAALDAEIERRFGADVEAALAGALDPWAQTPEGVLALVLVLDQFPRSIHRGSPRAFEGDAKAMELVEDAHARGLDRALDWEQRHFLLTPYLHAEHAPAHDRAQDLFRRCLAECPPLNRVAFAAGLEQAEKYRAVLLRFGRFPHRNEALGRVSTPDEIEFLKDWEQQARPAVMERKGADPR
jgi:uncharacterized protein (DUF924 family)